MADCIFCKILVGEIPSKKVYEDDLIYAFRDIYPKARVHILIVPREHVDSVKELKDTQADLVGKMVLVAKKLAEEEGLKGYRLQFNVGKLGGQEVFHLHLHLLGD